MIWAYIISFNPARGQVPDINSQTPRRRLSFSGAFDVFRHFSVIFRVFCLVIKSFLLNLQPEKALHLFATLSTMNLKNYASH